MITLIPESLPCDNCPSNSRCCKWGTFLSEQEGKNLEAEFGDNYIFFDKDKQEYRTQTWNGRCMFFKNNKCSIHNHKFYPDVCKKFPWKDGRNTQLPFAYDADLCSEIIIKI